MPQLQPERPVRLAQVGSEGESVLLRSAPMAQVLASWRSLSLFVFAAALGLPLGCAPAAPLRASPELECNRVIGATPEPGSLEAALARAATGDCVVASEGTYTGAFIVPEGVTLAAEEGGAVDFVGTDADQPALRLGPRSGSTLYKVRVRSAEGVGILVEGGPARLLDVTVEEAQKTALLVTCDPPCIEEGQAVELRDPTLMTSANGLWIRGAFVQVEGGSSTRHSSNSLSSGIGVIASHGARLEMSRTRVEDNQEVGVLVDGALNTGATLRSMKVMNNRGRGIWAQGLLGSDEDIRLRVEGPEMVVEGNRITGIGARDSRGIIIVNTRVAQTLAVEVPVGIGQTASVGDGIGLFAGSGSTRIDQVLLEDNGRSQALVDQGSTGIIIVNTRTGGGQYGVVVQRTPVEVSAPPDQRSHPTDVLAVSSPKMLLE